MEPIPREVETVIIVARELASFCQFLRPRHEAQGWSLVLLDRRTPASDRFPAVLPFTERRIPTPPAAAALTSVLGFMVLHRAGTAWLP
jgi:hypothetical protein